MTSSKRGANMHPEDVKAAVRKTGVSLRGLGRRIGVSGDTLRKSLRQPCPKGNRPIAAYLNKPLYEIWPEWYDADGARILPSGRKTSSAEPPRHREKRDAA